MRKYRKPYRIKKKKSILKGRFFWLGILVFAAVVGIFYFICFFSFFQIKEIKISGNSAFAEASVDKQKVPIKELQELIEKEIEKKILSRPSKSIFLIDLNKINKMVLEEFPQAAKVNLKREFPNTILIEIEERKPVAIFCQTHLSFPSENFGGQDENCFFIDKEGIIFELLDPNVTKQGLVTLKKEAGLEISLGKKTVKEDELSKILEIEAKIKNELKIPINEVLIVSEERLNVKTLEGWEIYFNLEGDINWQLTKLGAVLEEEILPENRKNLEYIDLRFGNLAPYKYKD